MPDTYYYAGGQRIPIERRRDRVAVRFREPERVRRGLAPEPLARLLRSYPVTEQRPDLRLTVLAVPARRGLTPALAELAADPGIELVSPVYRHPGVDETILVSDRFVCQFRPGVSRAEQEALHRAHRVLVIEPLEFAPNGFLLAVEAASGANAVAVANLYHETGRVLFAHADFAKPRQAKHARLAAPTATARRPGRAASAPARLARQWHLENTGQSGGTPGVDARVRAAWRLHAGKPSVTVAVIDDGFDLGHPDFAPTTRLRHPFDARTASDDPRPQGPTENHGTCVLGVAGSGGRGSGLLGVAPRSSLMPIRLDGSELDEARALATAVARGADVVNCSWGPPDGAWWDPHDPLHRHRHPLPDVVAAAMRFALERGRNGLGTVLVWAAGNGNESVSNDGYASAPMVIAVAALNHDDRRSVYSDHGPEVALAAPSSDIAADGTTRGGIWTSDRRGDAGYNPGAAWTDAFGGTSSAAPLVAGVAALVLSANPRLSADQVRAVLLETAARCDPGSRTWKRRGGRLRSDWYGAGRVDAEAAVARALDLARPTRRRA